VAPYDAGSGRPPSRWQRFAIDGGQPNHHHERRANGHPALAAYLPDEQGVCRGYGIMVLTVAGDQVATITGFPTADLYPIFGLPATDDLHSPGPR
jgi:hypothetical protein